MKKLSVLKPFFTLVASLFGAIFLFLCSTGVHAQGAPSPSVTNSPATDEVLPTLEVIDSFVEVRTGPGRGYPIFHVIEQGESVEVLTRRTGWYEVRSQNGQTGWATSKQLSRTLQATGEPADLPTVSFGDYQKNKWRVGFTFGEYFSGELDGADLFSATLSYRFIEWLSLETEVGKLFLSEIEGEYYNANILVEPFSNWRLSPELIIGAGNISVENQPLSVDEAVGDSSFLNYGFGLNYYIGRNFIFRGEYRRYSISADDKVNLDSWKIGFNTFF